MSWPIKKAGSDPLLWGRNSISDVIADARASLQQPSRPFTPRNLAQVLALFFSFLAFCYSHSVIRFDLFTFTTPLWHRSSARQRLCFCLKLCVHPLAQPLLLSMI